MSHRYDVLVIGGSQAGLAMGYFLKKQNISFAIVDGNKRVGDSWRHRYDSLVLFTPRSYSSLPGMPFPGDPSGYPTKDETAAYLESYAKTFSLPVHLETIVEYLGRTGHGFLVKTSTGEYLTKQVVVATGPFQKPFIPSLANTLDHEIFQIHSSQYKNPNQLLNGDVLIVGAGNSGAQIAVELAKSRKVTLAIGHKIKFLPLEIASKSIFWWFDKLGVYRANIHTPLGKWVRRQPDPVFGFELKLAFKNKKIEMKPKGIAAEGKRISFLDGTHLSPANIIWATGFRFDYSWLQIPDVIDSSERPVHDRGITPIPGLYFLGLPWQYRRSSALIGGVGYDAEYLINEVLKMST